MKDLIKEGQDAKNLLANPLLNETLTTIESALIDQWKVTSSPDDRDEIWNMLKGLERFVSVLTIAVEGGDAEKAIMEKYNER
jgi:hypothetical protein